MSTINSRIAEARKKLGMTQAQFAEALSIKQPALAMIETGKREVPEKNIKLICLSYNIREEWLRYGIEPMQTIPEDETAAYVSDLLEEDNPLYDLIKAIMKTYSQVDEGGKQVIKAFAQNLSENLQKKSRD